MKSKKYITFSVLNDLKIASNHPTESNLQNKSKLILHPHKKLHNQRMVKINVVETRENFKICFDNLRHFGIKLKIQNHIFHGMDFVKQIFFNEIGEMKCHHEQ